MLQNIELIDIKTSDLDELIKKMSSELLLENGKIKLLPYNFYDKYTHQQIRLFFHHQARYGIPTTELVYFLKDSIIKDLSAIEIGCGHGDLGYHLGIKTTDSRMQENKHIAKIYKAMLQPVIKYPDDVEKLDAIEAIKKYKPKVVVASWVTQWVDISKTPYKTGVENGVKENEILELVDTYVLIGNLDSHGNKDIFKYDHTIVSLPTRSRATDQSKNFIATWNKGDY